MPVQKKRPSPFLIVGLTGGIGMGKSTVAALLRQMHFPIYNADKAVHDVLKKNGKAVLPVSKVFPETVRNNTVSRKLLGKAVFGQPKKLKQLEKIIHPLLRAAEQAAIKNAKKKKARVIFLEIPLLFETKAETRCDVTFCVSAPRAIQKARVLSRPGMNEEKLNAIIARQMPDAQKRKKADFVIPTGAGLEKTKRHLSEILKKLSLLS